MTAIERGRAGDRAGAAAELERLWHTTGSDALQRVTIAHFLADLQDDPHDELLWDTRALDAVALLTDERAQGHHASLQVAGFLPSLHLNLADVLRRLGRDDEARAHLATSRAHLASLADDGYGATIRAGVRHVEEAIAAGHRERLPSH